VWGSLDGDALTFALVREEGRWWIVLDHFSPYPA